MIRIRGPVRVTAPPPLPPNSDPLKKIDSYRHNLQRAAKGKPIVWRPDPRCRPYGLPKDKRHVRTNPPNPPEPSGRPVIRSAGPK